MKLLMQVMTGRGNVFKEGRAVQANRLTAVDGSDSSKSSRITTPVTAAKLSRAFRFPFQHFNVQRGTKSISS